MGLLNLRNALMTGKRLPYDAEVEYLESTGTQWIDTGVYASLSTVVQLCFLNVAQTGNLIFGTYNSNDNADYRLFNAAQGLYFDAYGRRLQMDSALNMNIWRELELGNFYVKDLATGEELLRGTTGTDKLPDATLTLNHYVNGSTQQNSKNRWAHVKIYQNGVPVRDYIPVRKGTVGYLYDPVTGKLFGNAGTGDFVLGPDVVPVEYIESHGTEWMDIYTFTGSETSLRYNIDFVITQDSSSTQDFVLGVSSLGNIGPRLARYSGVFCYSCDSGNVVFGQPASLNQRYEIDFTYNSDGTIESSINGGAVSTYQRAFYSSRGSSNYLFGLVRNSVYGMIGRVYRMKMWADSTLVHNFIPVRVGTDATSWEGAMMDILTRRIYRNAGTGAFTYGNDRSYPIPA